MPPSSAPLVVEVTRGPAVESTHVVDLAIRDDAGAVVADYGDTGRLIYPRSANKALQALPLIETGAADAHGLTSAHLALACASHYAEPYHVTAATQMLAAAGCEPQDLECGAAPPRRAADRDALALRGEKPTPLHNPCSGKHAGFLNVAKRLGVATAGYAGIDHPVQRLVAETQAAEIRAPHGPGNHGVDGCSIPTYRVPLDHLAAAYARFGAAHPSDAGAAGRAAAMRRLLEACFAHPEYVSGSGGICTQIMTSLKGRAFVKDGAEGVMIASLPELGFGVAAKARDGALRGVAASVAWVIADRLTLSSEETAALSPVLTAPVTSRRGEAVGEIRAAAPV